MLPNKNLKIYSFLLENIGKRGKQTLDRKGFFVEVWTLSWIFDQMNISHLFVSVLNFDQVVLFQNIEKCIQRLACLGVVWTLMYFDVKSKTVRHYQIPNLIINYWIFLELIFFSIFPQGIAKSATLQKWYNSNFRNFRTNYCTKVKK